MGDLPSRSDDLGCLGLGLEAGVRGVANMAGTGGDLAF